MKIACVSDLHGRLPHIDPCDLLLIAGDICPDRDDPTDSVGSPAAIFFQSKWLGSTFADWLAQIPAKEVVAICGNHDWIFQKRPDMVPKDLRWHYLQDSEITLSGLKLYGTPWQPYFEGWAFNAPPDQKEGTDFLRKIWDKIPDDTDILLTHQPPYGYGDGVVNKVETKYLTERINIVRPKLVVCGHIHSGRGTFHPNSDTIVINAAILDDAYRPVDGAVVLEMDGDENGFGSDRD